MGKPGFVDPFDEFRKNRDRVTKKHDGPVADAAATPAPAPAAEKKAAPAKPVEAAPEAAAPVPAAAAAGDAAAAEGEPEQERAPVPPALAEAARAAYVALGTVQPNARRVAIPEWPDGAYARITPRAPERGEIVATLGLSIALPPDAPPFEIAFASTAPAPPWVFRLLDHYVRRAAAGELVPHDGVFQGHPLPPGSPLERAILVPWLPAVTVPTDRGEASLERLVLLRKEEATWATLFGRDALVELMPVYGLLSGAPERRGLLEIFPARPKILEAQKAAGNAALARAVDALLAAAPAALDRVVPAKGPGTGWEEAGVTAYGDGAVELEVFSKSGVKRSARWRWSDAAAAPAVEGQPVPEVAEPVRSLCEAAGLVSAEPAATKPGRFLQVTYKLARTGDGTAKGELRTY